MQKRNTYLLFFLGVFLLFSCGQKTFESKEALWDYLKEENNGYLQTKNINGYDFSLLYKPTDLLVLQELGENSTDEEIKKLRKKYKKQLYFTLSMSRNGKELLSTTPKNRQEFGAMVNRLAFGMGNKVHLYTAKKDTLPLIDYNYPRMYGMSGATTMLFVYPRDQKYLQACTELCRSDETLSFTIQDLGTYTGEVKFKINIEKLNNEPQLSFLRGQESF